MTKGWDWRRGCRYLSVHIGWTGDCNNFNSKSISP